MKIKISRTIPNVFTATAMGVVTVFFAGCNSSNEIPNIGNLRDVDVSTLETGIEAGTLARDIVGYDSSGEKFLLSDYRGKVVLLDFWGDW